VAALAAIPGLGGIITGRAMYEGRFTIAEALAVLAAGVRR
jgi:phosphoribosylformimino-5-aminoimidazole carboxamide ribotide isomerase